MRRFGTIARREIRGYFDQPTAYVLLVAFLSLGLFLTFRSLYAQHIGTLRPFFDLLPWLLALFAPAVTMRSLAEERRGRTLEWLMAQPVSERDVVVGKFLGDWTLLLIALAATVPTAIGIIVVAHADPGLMLAQYIGGALLAAQATALGLWASSITRNQITAFIVAACASLALMLIGLPIVAMGLPGRLASVAATLSVFSHFTNVARGVVDLRDVLYFVTSTALFLMLAGVAVARERLSRTRGAYRRLRISAAAMAVGILVLNLLGGSIGGRLDLTRDRLYTLAPGTRALVGSLKDVVQVKLFVSNDLPPEVELLLRDVRDILGDMRRSANGNLLVTELNPDADSTIQKEAMSYGIQPTEFNVYRGDELQVKNGWMGIALLYGNEHRVIPLVDQTQDLEFRVATIISSLTHTAKPRVASITGFGMPALGSFQVLSQAMGDQYDLVPIDLQAGPFTALSSDSARVAVVIAPSTPVDSTAVKRLTSYIDAGGSVLFLLENMEMSPQTLQARSATTGFEGLLQERGVVLRRGIVFDLRAHAAVDLGEGGPFTVGTDYPLWPVLQRASEHSTTRGLNNLSVEWAAPLRITDSAHVQPLWKTTDQGGVRPADLTIDPKQFARTAGDSMGVQVVAAAVDPGAGATGAAPGAQPTRAGRLIVVGDADFLADDNARQDPQGLLFVLNSIDWLAQDESLIRIRSKDRTPPQLLFASTLSSSAFKWGNLAGVPLLFVAFGAIRLTGRRRRAQKIWGSTPEAHHVPDDALASGSSP